jgi:tRNA modification GTPase
VPAVATSSVTGVGLDELARQIADRLGRDESSSVVAATAVRCRQSLAAASEALGRASEAARLGLGDELIALELRLALEELGRIVGAVYSDDLLDRIFSRFCIGK